VSQLTIVISDHRIAKLRRNRHECLLVEIKGRAVLALNTDCQAEAEEEIASHTSGEGTRAMRDDLMRLRDDNGDPIWDGKEKLLEEKALEEVTAVRFMAPRLLPAATLPGSQDRRNCKKLHG
jgi:hypothetical protein